MTRDNVTTARLLALEIIQAMGEVLDYLQTIDETLANPTPHAADIDRILVAQATDGAAGTADALANSASELAHQLDGLMRESAHQRLAATEGVPA